MPKKVSSIHEKLEKVLFSNFKRHFWTLFLFFSPWWKHRHRPWKLFLCLSSFLRWWRCCCLSHNKVHNNQRLTLAWLRRHLLERIFFSPILVPWCSASAAQVDGKSEQVSLVVKFEVKEGLWEFWFLNPVGFASEDKFCFLFEAAERWVIATSRCPGPTRCCASPRCTRRPQTTSSETPSTASTRSMEISGNINATMTQQHDFLVHLF